MRPMVVTTNAAAKITHDAQHPVTAASKVARSEIAEARRFRLRRIA